MKKLNNKDFTISFKERTPSGVKEKSFNVEKKHVAWHMQKLREASETCYDATYNPRKEF